MRTPVSTDAEIAVLGASLVSGEVDPRVARILEKKDFHDTFHGDVWEAINERRADTLEAAEHLKGLGYPDDVVTRVNELMFGVPKLVNVVHYATLVRETSVKRQAFLKAREIGEMFGGGSPTIEVLREKSNDLVASLSSYGVGGYQSALSMVDEILDDVQSQEAGDRPEPVGTGFDELDELILDYEIGRLTVWGARPSMGKTAMAVSNAMMRADLGRPGIIFTMEMGAKELIKRALSQLSGIPLRALDKVTPRNPLGDEKWLALVRARKMFESLDLTVISDCDMSFEGITAEVAARDSARISDDLPPIHDVWVDYLQIANLDSSENRNLSIGKFTRKFKRWAQSARKSVHLLSQLKRSNSDDSTPPQPTLSDLRESGNIEQDADTVILIHRPAHYLGAAGKELGEEKDKAYMIVAKQRNGPVGVVVLGFREETMTFSDPWWS